MPHQTPSTPENLVPKLYLCERFGITPQTASRWIREGIVHAWRVGPRMIYLDRDEVENLIRPVHED